MAVTPPTNFRRTDCVQDVGAGPDTLASYRLDWSNGSGASGWEVVTKASNDTTGSMPVLVSGSGTASTWTPGHVSGTAGTQYFFLRNLFGTVPSRWVPMNTNPIDSSTLDHTCRIVV